MPSQFTTREIADLLNVDLWRVQRLFETGALPEPPRFGNRRVIQREQIPTIIDALRARRWLETPEAVPV